MGLPTIDSSATPQILADQIIETEQQKSFNLMRDIYTAPVNVPLAFVDTTVSSLANISDFTGLTDFNLHDGVMPAGWDSYQRNREAWQATSDIASLFFIAGAATKGIQAGGSMATFARSKGVSDDVMAAMFSNRAQAGQIAEEFASYQLANQGALASRGLQAQGITDVAVPWASLGGARYTADQARQMGLRIRRNAAIKETVAAEVAVVALMNDSEFLFGEDASLMSYLVTAGFAGGVVTAIDRAIGAAGYRRALAQAAQGTGEVAAAARGNEITYGQASNVVGQRWTGLSAGANEANRADALVDAVASGQVPEAQAEVMRTAATRIRQEALRDMTDRAQQLYADAPLSRVSLSANKGAMDAARADRIIEWTRKDQKNSIGLQSFEEPDVLQRMEVETSQAHRQMAAAKRSGNADQITKAQRRLDDLDAHHAGVLEADGSVNLSRTRKAPWQEQSQGGKTTLRRGSRKETFMLQDKGAPKVELTKAGAIMRKVGKSLNYVGNTAKLGFDEATALYKTVALGISDFSQSGFGKQFVETFDGNYDALPYQLLDAVDSGLLDLSKIGPVNREALTRLETGRASGDVAKQALFQKYNAFAANSGGETAFDLSKRTNMQLHDEHGMHTELYEAFEKLRIAGVEDLGSYFKDQTLDEVLTALAASRGGANQTTAVALKDKLRTQMRGGNMLSLHEQPKATGFVRRTLDGASDTDANFAKIAETARTVRLTEMAQTGNPFISAMRSVLGSMENVAQAASDVGSLTRDGLIESRGLLAGAARGVTQTTNRFRENPAIQHAHTLGQAFKRESERMIDQIVRPVAEMHAELVKNQRYEVLAQHSDYSAVFRVGGELEADYLVAGLNAMDKNSHRVRQLTKNMFGKTPEELVGDQPLYVFDKAAAMRGEYKPLNFDEEATTFINSMIEASYNQLETSNELARMMGRAETNRVRGHVPVADFSRLEMRYVADESGKTVGYVTAKTAQEAEALQRKAIEYARLQQGRTLMPASDTHVKQWVETRDQHRFAALTDYGDPMLQNGVTKGRNIDATRDVSGDVGSDQLIALRESFDGLRAKTIYAMLEPQILKNRQLARVGNASQLGQQQRQNGKRVFFNANEEWENVLFANSGRPEGSMAYKIENTAVAWMEDVFDQAARKFAGVKGGSQLSKAQQDAIDRIVGSGYDPMGAAARELLKVSRSADDRKIASTLQAANKVTGEVFLKFANIAHPILNLMSVAVTTPAVSQQLVRRAGESVDDWKRRAGPWADFMDEDSVATTSATKLMSNGMAFFHSDEGARILKEAADDGFITANMLEELNVAIFKTPTKAGEVADAVRRYADFINAPVNAIAKRRGVELSADTISERSETFVRSLLHATGYQFARSHMREGMSNRELHSFAHWFANQNIADYAPNIRGQAFRGVSGIPLGLFQSFGINFLQRMFRYVENADTRALAVQAATQTAVFGAEGLPGWPAINEYFMAAHDRGGDADATMTDRLYNAYGKQVGDVLMTGTVSNLPRLFGAGDGINFYTSGDANPRVFSFTPPAFALASQSAEMVRQALKAETEQMKVDGMGAQRTAEVVASYMPNRGVRSMMELALGYSTDRAGDLVTQDTRSGMNLVARLLGTRTVDEVRTRNALYNNRVDEQHRRARLAQVGRAFTAAIRSQSEELGQDPDSIEVSQDQLDAYLARWVAQGGRLDTSRTAFNRMIDKAQTPEAQREMRKYVDREGVLKGGDIYQYAMERLLHYGYDSSNMPFETAQ